MQIILDKLFEMWFNAGMSISKDRMEISNIKVAELREFLGLTLAEFADILGYDQSYISKIESGKNAVTAQFIIKITDEFHMKPAKLFED